MKTQHVLWFNECTADRADRIGGKALGLGLLLNYGLTVPPGFTVTTDAYRECVAAAGLTERIKEIYGKASNNREISERVSALFTEDMLTPGVAAAITEAYERLGGSAVAVAVRSSATAEDTAAASFAGQQETYLWIRGAAAVRKHVVRCWASLFTQRAIDYRARIKVPLEGLAMGVVVQQMVPAEAAGVIMTLHPVSGDRSQIYIESSFGLGEIVVRGEVDPDRFCVDKKALSIVSEEIGTKERAYQFDEKLGKVELVNIPASDQQKRSLSESEVRAAAELARKIETHFGKPMDIEWAVATRADKSGRDVFLLQARPETIWSNKPVVAPVESPEDVRGRFDKWDTLQSWTDPDRHWTTSIIGEDVPGVLTPLCWSLWGHAAERSGRECIHAMGVFSGAERRVPERIEDRFIRVSYGRITVQIEYLIQVGDRMPGTSGEETAKSLFARVPETIEFHPTKRRYPIIAWRFPWTFLTAPPRIRKLAREYDHWYEETVGRVATLDREAAIALFREAAERFETAMVLQATGLLCVVQPLYGALAGLVKSVGVGDLSTLTAQSGGAELAVVLDTWKVSRGQMEFEKLKRKHGYHGPGEGEISSHTWREDDSPLRAMVSQFAKLDESKSPLERERKREIERQEAERQIIEAVSPLKRPAVRLLLKLARERLIFRGLAKESFLQALDVCRACARRIGAHLVAAGTLKDPEDVFFLTAAELTGTLPADVQELVARRRGRREAYQKLEIPTQWTGIPEATLIKEATAAEAGGDGVIKGIGVSSGVFEGIARVVMSPSAEVEPGQVLVAPTTDPSWTSIMFISSALVVDIGGALSHAAVVARELGIPCIVNTRTGTKTLKDGDRVRVDGTKGTVEILERRSAEGAAAGEPSPPKMAVAG